MPGNYCTDEIWNLNKSWNADVPDFSSCFQDTLLVLVPCVIFSSVSIVNLCLLSRRIPVVPLPWAWRLILKLILGVVLFIVSVIWCSMYTYQKLSDESSHLPVSTITASFARSVTFIIIIALMLKHRQLGIATSTILSLFWICFAFCGVLMHRSIILKYDDEGLRFDWNYVLAMLYYPLVYLGLILSFFADSKNYTLLERGNPLDEEPFLSSVTYIWFNKTVYRAMKRRLTVKDFLPLAVKLKASYLYDVFSKHWKFNVFSTEAKKQSLSWALLKSFWPWLTLALVFDFCFVLTLLVPPLLIDEILQFVEDDHFLWRKYYYCVIILTVTFVNKCLQNNYLMYLLCAAGQVKSSLISAVFRKNLIVASSSRKDFTSGSITNLISVDIQRISTFAVYSSTLITSPFRIILIIYFMWKYLGPSCLAGVAVIVAMIPISFYISNISEKYTTKQMEVKDMRLKIINEILSGIKILKLYAWEIPFSKKISETRKEEMKLIRFSQFCYVVTSFVFYCAPILVSIASFSTYLLVDSKNTFDPKLAFVSLNLLDQLRFALFIVPDGISELIQTITAITRITNFLTTEETDPNIVGNSPNPGEAVTIKQGNFFWSKDTNFALENIDLNVSFGHLIAIIGPVGSGKSSLLSAILGEMKKSSGSIDVKGTLAYVPQEAWILNRTLKNNILLEKPMHEQKYNRILECCCLKPDLEILPAGDATEIGEKGINLSGGQKQRVSVARAIFQNRDIYIMDDPLSAVDAHVRKALFEDVISNNGLLKNKTRLLVTHDISVLPHVDLIIRMDEGKIVESGTYKELMDSKGTFLDFIRKHAGSGDEASADENSCALVTYDKKKESYGRTISEDWAKPSETKENEGALIEEEVMEEGGVKHGIYLSYAKQIGWPILSISLLGYIAFTAIEAGGNIWVSKWTADPVLNGTQNHKQTIWRLSIYAAFGAAEASTIILGISALVFASTKAASSYHSKMLDSVLKSPMSFFDVTPMGRIVNRFSTDMDTIDIHLIYNIDGWISCLLHILVSFTVLGINTPLFLASIIPLCIVYFVFLGLHLNTSRQIKRLESTTKSPIYSHMLESIYGVVSIKAFQVEEHFIEKLEESLDNNIACTFNVCACNRWLHFWLDIIGCLIIFVATWLAIENRHELGASVVGLILAYALAVPDSLMWFVRTNNELENQSVAVERVDEYSKLPSEAPRNIPDTDPETSWPDKGEIVFDNYSTKYRENLDLVLKSLNLNIHSSEKVGIVGRTGAGKSSVTLALFRIIEPSDGTILIDNVDLTQIGLHALRSKLTIIPQDPVLFTGSLRFNLDPNDEYDDSEIWTSLENAHLKDYVSSLPEKLEHNVEEGGANLSAGQKQLLCLARALLKKSKILILDEATAAVDMDTDRLVQDTIKRAFAKHTVITIAHRLNTVMDYDKIVVMDSGEVAEVGSPGNLLENKQSQFYYLCKEAGLT